MKKAVLKVVFSLSLLLVFLASVACGEDLEPRVDELETQVSGLETQVTNLEAEKATMDGQVQVLMDIVGPLPASLDQYFPPLAEAPVFLFEMFALSGPFEGIGTDLQQGDISGAQANYEAFKAQYEKVAGLVPEWEDLMPMGPVEVLGQALAGGNPAEIGQAMGGVGQVCSSCHLINQTKAHQKYHWPSFEEVKITDPISGEEMDWHDYMFAMAGAFNSASNDLRQGQRDNALTSFEAFKARFEALAEDGCKQCHKDPITGEEIPREYFVDESVMEMIDQFGQALAATPPDAQSLEQLGGAIGNESCMKCHLVHLPAATRYNLLEHLDELLQ